MSTELSDETLAMYAEAAENSQANHVMLPSASLLELVRAYQYHKQVKPIHIAIHEACKRLGM